MAHSVDLTDQQWRDAQRVFDMGAMNGIIAIAAGLRGRGLLTDPQVNFLFDSITKPFSDPEVSNNPAVDLMRDFISDSFAALLTHKPPTD